MQSPLVFQHIGIIGKYRTNDVADTINCVIALLDKHQITYTLDTQTMPEQLKQHPHCKAIQDWDGQIDLAIVIGGDGTFLYAGRTLLKHNIPLLGINAGHLGFLADIHPSNLDKALMEIFRGNYSTEIRQTLHIGINNQGNVQQQFYAINDAVIHKRHMARMIELDLYTRQQLLAHYRADGLIIATPTGSTAYALSAGGPIIEPSLEATLIVPICPHTLMQRPVVLDAERIIRAEIHHTRYPDVQITIDGQEEYILNAEDTITVKQAPKLTVIHPADYSFQQRLRQKLNWGVNDPTQDATC